MLQTFLPQFMMTFFICLFIVMMQFLWKYVDELVGKGLSISLVAELFFYAALTMVPLALPLSILLASLMTFGNLGEHVELTALKSSGISLIKVMKPLAWLMVVIAVIAFFFQNDIGPKVQVKMWTLMFSMRQKTPTIDIPEGAVYTQIPGYNLYVKHKDEQTNMLYGVLIYDVSGGGTTYPRIVAADSGSLSMTPDKQHLLLNLYHGNWYEDMGSGSGAGGMKGPLYRRETFHDKEIVVSYDATFTRMDDEAMKQQYVGKNINQLQQTIDSVNRRIDSIGSEISGELHRQRICGVPLRRPVFRDSVVDDEPLPPVPAMPYATLDTLLAKSTPAARRSVMTHAVSMARSMLGECEFRGYVINDDSFVARRHNIEWHKKFTLSLACLIFFFIGAPLGAIIRKGGLGMPIVMSVILFVVYYVIDNTGYKLARDARWPVWQGVWLSSAVLAPLGAFLTYKAVNDSALLDSDTYMKWWRRLTGTTRVRKLEIKEIIINEVDNAEAMARVSDFDVQCAELLALCGPGPQGFTAYFREGIDRRKVQALCDTLDKLVDYLSNSRDQMVLAKAMDYPVLRQGLVSRPVEDNRRAMALMALLPVSLPIYLLGRHHQRMLINDLKHCQTVNAQMLAILSGNYTRDDEYNM